MEKTRKKYYTYKIGIVIPITVNGTNRFPKFVWSYLAKRGEFSTSDPEMQAAIESNVFFQKGIIKLDPYSIKRTEVIIPAEDTPAEDTPVEDVKEAPAEDTPVIKNVEVGGYKEAKQYLSDAGIDVSTVVNVYILRKVAKANNILFNI